jgi:hypothetical protein
VAEVKIEYVPDVNGGRIELFAEDDGGAWVGFPLTDPMILDIRLDLLKASRERHYAEKAREESS